MFPWQGLLATNMESMNEGPQWPLQNSAELTSLGLTLPTLVFAFYVIVMWGPTSVRILSDLRKRKEVTSTDWLILGVAISFTGSFLDNLYWSIPWTLSFLGSEYTDAWMSFGCFPNIFMRQLAGILAGFCHVQSAAIYLQGKSRAKTFFFCSVFLAFLSICLLLLMRSKGILSG